MLSAIRSLWSPPAIRLRDGGPEDRLALAELWLASVEATHDFLTPGEIAELLPLVRDAYLPGAVLRVAVDGADRPLAFLGREGADVEALYVAPSAFGHGLGRTLLLDAAEAITPLRIDVNAENLKARAFYARMGFRETGRTALDHDGRTFPLIHLEGDPRTAAPGKH